MKKHDLHFTEGLDFPFQVADDVDAECDDEVLMTAREAFGIQYLFPWQRIVIANILDSATGTLTRSEEGEDDAAFYNGRQIVLLPTGAGKSLCFLTPALMLNGATLVIYPLLALMADQKRRMDEGGIKSVVLRGGQTEQERELALFRIKSGEAKIVLANPEVLQNEKLVHSLSQCRIEHVAIDEAHCVSEWGDSFRPAYLTLGKIIKDLGCKTVTAFTATASPPVLERVSEVLFDGSCHVVRSESDRPNIHYYVINAYDKKREAVRLALTKEKPALIFCGTRKNSEDMARELLPLLGKEKVRFYHAGLTREEKHSVEEWYYPKDDAVLCATCAFGMGVDKKNIRTVIHLEASPTIESYIQEAGRGARDGKTANAFLLWSYDDIIKFKSFAQGSRERLILDFATSTTCRRQVLLDALGAEQAACDGCDVCERGSPAPFAEDALFVLSFIKSHRKLYSKDEAACAIIEELNRRDNHIAKRNIWDDAAVTEILRQLEDEHLIRECHFLWRSKLTCSVRKQKPLPQRYYSAPYKKLVRAEKRLIFLPRRLKKRFLLLPAARVRQSLGRLFSS